MPSESTYTLLSYSYTYTGDPSSMKQKLTITVDMELVPAAKRYARSRGVSLSSLIEQSLRETIGEENPSFSERWRGEFRPAERDDPRYDALAEKYLR